MPTPVLESPLRLPPAQTPTTHSASDPKQRLLLQEFRVGFSQR